MTNESQTQKPSHVLIQEIKENHLNTSDEDELILPSASIDNGRVYMLKRDDLQHGKIHKKGNVVKEEKTYAPKLKIHGKSGEVKYLILKCNAARENQLRLFIDCGSDENIVNINALKSNVNFCPERKMNLVGISGSTQSLGMTILPLRIGRKNAFHEFQLVTERLPDNVDGILGKPVTDHSIVDFSKSEFTYQDEKKEEGESLTKYFNGEKDSIKTSRTLLTSHQKLPQERSNKPALEINRDQIFFVEEVTNGEGKPNVHIYSKAKIDNSASNKCLPKIRVTRKMCNGASTSKD